MTDPTPEEINSDLAKALGWQQHRTKPSGYWHPNYDHWNATLPDYLNSPAASCELEDWLHRQWIEAQHCVERKHVAVWLKRWRPIPKMDEVREVVELDGTTPSAARRAALARAAHKALCPQKGGRDGK